MDKVGNEVEGSFAPDRLFNQCMADWVYISLKVN